MDGRSEEESRLQLSKNQLEYIGETWRAVETCCHLDLSKEAPVKTAV